METVRRPQRETANPTISLPNEDTYTHTLPPPSPAHDFSFTISLHPPLTSHTATTTITATTTPNKSCTTTIDLSPADDIFLHGHLLPLDIISSARSSVDTITTAPPRLPVDRISSDLSLKYNNHNNRSNNMHDSNKKAKVHKPPLPSIFSMWKNKENGNNTEEKPKSKKRGGLDLVHMLKKYASMVEQLFMSKGEKARRDMRRRPHSFSGHSNPREPQKWRKKRGQMSAPGSLRTSPANSGHLSLGSLVKLSTASSDESTMEELHTAIQAAIAHCKNSIAAAKVEKCTR